MHSAFAEMALENAPDPPLITAACPFTLSPCLIAETPSPNSLTKPENPFPRLMGIGVVSSVTCSLSDHL
ncbi:MAG: hypothetical protein WBL88_04685 [Nitrososphaeraceae archaeon]